MFHNWSDRTVAIVCMIVIPVCLGLLLVIGPLPPADGAAPKGSDSAVGRTYKTVTLCVYKDRQGDDRCGRVRLNANGPGAVEGRERAARIERETPCSARWMGWASKPLENFTPDKFGHKYFAGQSFVRPDRWHIYKVKCPVDERGV